MRTRLNPDASKMIICTTSGYLIIIHNLDLTTMAQDLAGFKVTWISLVLSSCLVVYELNLYVMLDDSYS
jgi:WD repeat-containing protein 32